MASAVFRSFARKLSGKNLFLRIELPYLPQSSSRSVVTTEFGGFLEEPVKHRFGLIKAAIILIPSVYFGGSFAKHGAAFLGSFMHVGRGRAIERCVKYHHYSITLPVSRSIQQAVWLYRKLRPRNLKILRPFTTEAP